MVKQYEEKEPNYKIYLATKHLIGTNHGPLGHGNALQHGGLGNVW